MPKVTERDEKKRITVSITNQIIDNINLTISIGYANDVHDFISKAIADKLEKLGIIDRKFVELDNLQQVLFDLLEDDERDFVIKELSVGAKEIRKKKAKKIIAAFREDFED
jgi:hypothetical protein